MDNTIPGGDDGSCVGQDNTGVVFVQLVDSLSHYFYISFYCTLAKCIVLKVGKDAFIGEKRCHFITCGEYVD